MIFLQIEIPLQLNNNQGIELELYIDEWQFTYRLVFLTAAVIIILLHLASFFVQYKDLRSPDLAQIALINEIVCPALQNALDSKEKYSVNKLLEAVTVQELVQVAQSDPEKFWKDYSDIVKFQILKFLEKCLKKKELKQLSNLVSEDINTKCDKIVSTQGMTRFDEYIEASMKAVNQNLMHLEFPSNGKDVSNYKLLVDDLRNFFSHCKELITNSSSQKEPNEKLQIMPDFNILENNDENESYFESTFASLFANQVLEEGHQNVQLETTLMKWNYDTQGPEQTPISFHGKKIDTSTQKILSIIEEKLKITREQSSETLQQCLMLIEKKSAAEGEILFKTQVCEDIPMSKSIRMIKNQEDQILPESAPHYPTIINNLKQVNLVFEEEADILVQLAQLRKQAFGSDYDNEMFFEEQNIQVSLREIINGFASDESAYTSKDLRIILEIFQKDLDQAVGLEINCQISKAVNFKKVEKHIEEWESQFELFTSSDKHKEILNQMENSSKCMVLVWRIIYFISWIILLQIIISTYIQMDHQMRFKAEECTASSSIPDQVVIKCINQHKMMNDEQLFIFCSDQSGFDDVRILCTNQPAIQQHHCMMGDTDKNGQFKDFFLKDLCTNHWASNQNRQSQIEQVDFCSKQSDVSNIYDSCKQLPGVQQEYCMMEPRDSVSEMCADQWTSQKNSQSVIEQIHFCNRFSLEAAIVTVCRTLNRVFKEVCLVQPKDNLSLYCEEWYADNQDNLDEIDNYLFCHQFQDNSDKLHDSCRMQSIIYQNICQMRTLESMQASQRCQDFFIEDNSMLSESQNIYFCQRQGSISAIAKVCYEFDQMQEFLQGICMAIPININNTACVDYFKSKHPTLTTSEFNAFCRQQKDFSDVTLICWETNGEPTLFIQNLDYDNVCAYTPTMISCIDETGEDVIAYKAAAMESILEGEEQDKFQNLSISNNSKAMVKLDKEYIGEAAIGIQGEKMSIQEKPTLEVQSTDNAIVFLDINRFMNTNLQFYQEFYYQMDKQIQMGNSHTCWLDNLDFSCSGESAQGNNIPDGWSTGILTAGTGRYHMCAIKSAGGKLKCWGENLAGQTDVPETLEEGNKDVMASENQTCILDSNRYLQCFGAFTFNDLPDDLIEVAIKMFDGQTTFSCAMVESNSEIICWGVNLQGGIDVPEDRQFNMIFISVGAQQTCGLDANRQVHCWGESTEIIADFANKPIYQLSTGLELNCVIREPDFAWICNSQQAGDVQTSADLQFTLAAGHRDICGGQTNGSVNCFVDYDNFITRPLEQYPTTENPFELPLDGQHADKFSLSQSGYICFTSFGQFYCTINKLKTLLQIDLDEDIFCTTVDQLCQVKMSDHTHLECVDPTAIGTPIDGYSVQEGKEIIQVGCNTKRVCVRFEDETILCMGGDNAMGESTIPIEFIECKQMQVGKETTCCMKEDKSQYCNGKYMDQGMPTLYDGLVGVENGSMD